MRCWRDEGKAGARSVVHHLGNKAYRFGLSGRDHVSPTGSFPLEQVPGSPDPRAQTLDPVFAKTRMQESLGYDGSQPTTAAESIPRFAALPEGSQVRHLFQPAADAAQDRRDPRDRAQPARAESHRTGAHRTVLGHPGRKTPRGRLRIQSVVRLLEEIELAGVLTLPPSAVPAAGRGARLTMTTARNSPMS